MLLDRRTLGKKLDDAMLVDPKYSSLLQGLPPKEKENWQKLYSRYKTILGSRSDKDATTRKRLMRKVQEARKEHMKRIAAVPTLDQAFFADYFRSNPEKVEDVLLAANVAAEPYKKLFDVEDKDETVVDEEDEDRIVEEEDEEETLDEEDEDRIVEEENADDDEALSLGRVATLAVSTNETTSTLADKYEGVSNTVDTLNSNVKSMNENFADINATQAIQQEQITNQQEQINTIRQQCTPRSGGGGLLRFFSPS